MNTCLNSTGMYGEPTNVSGRSGNFLTQVAKFLANITHVVWEYDLFCTRILNAY